MTAEKNGKSLDVYVIPTESSEQLIKPKSFWHVDKQMIRFKLHYFLYIGGFGAANPYVMVFAKEQIGLSASSLGSVLIAQFFIIIFTKPLIGYIADYFNRVKMIICVLTIITALSYFLLLINPKIDRKGARSSIDITENHLDTMNLCQKNEDIIALMENTTKFSFRESLESNYTEIQTANKQCTLCALDTESCLKKCMKVELHEYFFTVISNEQNSVDFLEGISHEKEQSVMYCDQDVFFSLSLCSYHHNNSCQNCSVKYTELLCASLIEMNQTNQRINSSYMCSLLPEGLKNVFDTCINRNSLKNDLVDTNIYEHDSVSDFATYQFWIFAIVFSVGSICANSIFTLSDTACCETVQKTAADFGKQRLWGAIGWGAVAPIGGFINDYTKGFVASWSLMGIMWLISIWNIYKLDLVKPHFSKNILKDVGTVLRSKEFLAFEIVIFINGVGAGMIWFYLILFLTSIGGSKLLCGLCLTIQSFVGSIPFMFFSGWIIRKIGLFQVCMLALFTYVIRFFWYSQLHNPWFALPIEWTHGLTYGLLYTALASYGKLSSKPGTEATTQSIIFTTHEGLGCGMGCVLAGVGFDYLGGHRTFFITSMYYACGLALSIFLCFALRRQKGKIKVTSPEQQ
ncbi:major facilitator superfamily domain-containing protein 6 [Trichonephila clavata]|uniref:Major facilitator superfamily domain-containing protein 6 n=1 Tax=Trichonephila clavata TaxID=2740835 RepID=A0A8X6F025_TRICU|nr:major facilitator superfamily domain-containing protein 6 [Trichonephila clavata]